MSLVRFIEPVRYRAVVVNLCLMLQLLAFLLVIPLAVSLLAREFELSLIFAGLGTGAFALGLLGRKGGEPSLDGKEALIVVGLSYLVFSLFGAVAFLPVASFWDGFFEAVSGFTTTGLSVMDVASLPPALLFFRGYSQWVGGIGIIILTLIVLHVPGREARKLYVEEFGKENRLGDIRKTARTVLAIYAILTAAGYLVYVLTGMGWFDALLHIMATVSTGGFSSHAGSLAYYPRPMTQLAVVFFMILGAVGFPAYYFLSKKRPKRFIRDPQLLVLLATGLAAAILYAAVWYAKTRQFLPSLFQSFSALTTTGFSTAEYSAWPPLVKGMSVILMIIGGSSYSTAGGVKIIRIIVFFKLVRWVVAKRLLPEAARVPIQTEGVPVSDTDLKNIFSFFTIYLIILAGSSLVFMLSGYGAGAALFENASALGTVGLSTGITSAGLPWFLKLVLIFDMWAGRLEILPVLVILFPAVWLNWRKT